MSQNVHIRHATKDDQTALGNLAGQLVRLHSAWNARRFMVIENVEAGYGRWLVKEAKDPDAEVFVAVRPASADGAQPETVIGYAYARFEARDFNQLLGPHTALHDIFVDPAARQGGVAMALLQAVRAESEKRGRPRMVLHTAVQNQAGQALFAKAGFAPTMIEMTWELGKDE